MFYKALLLTMIAVIIASALFGTVQAPAALGGPVDGAIGGAALGITIDLVLGLAVSFVLAIVRVAAGTELKTHHRIG